MRRRLPEGVRMYTGDDFNYAELIAGDGTGYSDALLGIFDAIAPAAAPGLARLREGTTRHSTQFSRPPCRSLATSSRHRRVSTRPAWCSWPISTACRIISPWWAARKAPVRRSISPSSSGSPTRPACLPPGAGSRAHARRHGNARRGSVMRDFPGSQPACDQHRHCQSLVAGAGVEGCARAGITAIAPWRDILAAMRDCARRKLIRGGRVERDLSVPRRPLPRRRCSRPPCCARG